MSTKKDDRYVDGWEGMSKEIASKSNVHPSQCSDCDNKVGTHACKVFGKRPREYASALANVKCPERKKK